MVVGLLMLLQMIAGRGHRRSQEAQRDHVRLAEVSGELDGSTGWSKRKWDEVNAATAAEAHARQARINRGLPPLPLFPTHTTKCGDHRCPTRRLRPATTLLPRTRRRGTAAPHDGLFRPWHRCRPGEGNMKGYKMWFQPYEHREYYVQSRSRNAPLTVARAARFPPRELYWKCLPAGAWSAPLRLSPPVLPGRPSLPCVQLKPSSPLPPPFPPGSDAPRMPLTLRRRTPVWWRWQSGFRSTVSGGPPPPHRMARQPIWKRLLSRTAPDLLSFFPVGPQPDIASAGH